MLMYHYCAVCVQQMKRKLEDVRRKLEILYDRLRVGTVRSMENPFSGNSHLFPVLPFSVFFPLSMFIRFGFALLYAPCCCPWPVCMCSSCCMLPVVVHGLSACVRLVVCSLLLSMACLYVFVLLYATCCCVLPVCVSVHLVHLLLLSISCVHQFLLLSIPCCVLSVALVSCRCVPGCSFFYSLLCCLFLFVY